MSRFRTENVIAAAVVLLGAGLLFTKAGEAKISNELTEEEKKGEIDGADPNSLEPAFIPPSGLGSLPISQAGGLTPNEYRSLNSWSPFPVDVRWIKNVWDYRNIYIAAYKKDTQFPGYVRVAQNGLVQLNNDNVYLGGNISKRLQVTGKTNGVNRIIMKQYTGPNAWVNKVYEFRS